MLAGWLVGWLVGWLASVAGTTCCTTTRKAWKRPRRFDSPRRKQWPPTRCGAHTSACIHTPSCFVRPSLVGRGRPPPNELANTRRCRSFVRSFVHPSLLSLRYAVQGDKLNRPEWKAWFKKTANDCLDEIDAADGDGDDNGDDSAPPSPQPAKVGRLVGHAIALLSRQPRLSAALSLSPRSDVHPLIVLNVVATCEHP